MKAALSLGCYPLTALTCAVSEVPGIVEEIIPMPASFVAGQLALCLKHYPVGAIKTGMLYSCDIVRAVAEQLERSNYQGALIVDPVMIATAGESLMQREAIDIYEQMIMPRCSILTPNIDEALALLGWESITSVDELSAAAQALQEKYNCAVLAKGGHLEGEHCSDVLCNADGSIRSWSHPRVNNVSTHGTGCTLSAAIAAGLAKGETLETAVEHALHYTEQAILGTIKWEKVQALGCDALRSS